MTIFSNYYYHLNHIIKPSPVITSEQSERSSYNQSNMGRLVDFKTALKPFKK